MQAHFCPSSGINIYGHFNLGHRTDETLAGCAAGLEYGSNWISLCTVYDIPGWDVQNYIFLTCFKACIIIRLAAGSFGPDRTILGRKFSSLHSKTERWTTFFSFFLFKDGLLVT